MGQEVKFFDFVKAGCLLPVDIVFLSISFLAAFLYQTRKEVDIQLMLGGVLIYVLAAIFVTYFSKRSEAQLLNAQNFWAGFHSFISYAISLFIIYITIQIGVELK
ncbi:hypothetical protein [Pseudovibrio sp. JE062]|uniref:hypothetical protein n=1 Tax=Pseudovibrio sp. JE062 TaxID=439495 RepID=UPI0012ECE236|nr:hypothetical protein [Pseudovibrio sp. JE062]